MTVRALIDRWYAELWNAWDTSVVGALVAPDCALRGSLGTELRGPDGVAAYVGKVHAAFPDFHNEVLEVFGDGDAAVARLRYTGTHQGHFEGTEPSGKAFAYEGLARFEARGGKLIAVTVYGDLEGLRRQLGLRAAPPPAVEGQVLIPTLRSTSWDASRAFYVALGFEVAFEWRHEPNFPVYAGLIGHGCELHVSEHAGDCQPGGCVSVRVADVEALHAELVARGVDAPQPIPQPWGRTECLLRDPDGNRVLFHTPNA